MIKIFILLDGVYISYLEKCCGSCYSHFDFITYIFQDARKNEKKHYENFAYNHTYNNINRGCYRDSTYIVKSGDTLFYVAWISGNSCVELARNNNIQNVNLLQVGQILKIHSKVKIMDFKKLLRVIIYSINSGNVFLKKTIFFIKKNLVFAQKEKNSLFNRDVFCSKNFNLKISPIVTYSNWHWPTYGKIINTFSESEGGNKGIDISGKFGQPILATTKGKVIYAGNLLQGYGNLIVIKHDNDYLSAYAHNDMILVTEQQVVNIGDKIATMGNSDANEIKLHFEIRYKGESVNPVYYLSKNY